MAAPGSKITPVSFKRRLQKVTLSTGASYFKNAVVPALGFT